MTGPAGGAPVPGGDPTQAAGDAAARPAPDGNVVARPAAPPALEVRGLSVFHGQLRALDGVSLAVGRGDVFAIIGANGAGKSTLLRTIAGLHRPASGSILLDGTDITALRPERRVRAGIALVPEGRRLFPSLTVEENLLVGATGGRGRTSQGTGTGPDGPAEPAGADGAAGPPQQGEAEAARPPRGETGPGWTLERVYEVFPWMPERRRQRAGQLSGGEQQAVAIGRALMSNPRVLLLDELSLGLSPRVVRQIYALLPQLLVGGLSVLLVEQDVSQAVRVAGRIACLLEGRMSLTGQPGEFSPQQIEAAYFGLAGSQPGRSAGQGARA